MDDFQKLAFGMAGDSTKLLVTLSTAALPFLVSFHKDYPSVAKRWTTKWVALMVALGLHLLSVGCGVYVLLVMAGGLNQRSDELNRAKDAEATMLAETRAAELAKGASEKEATARGEAAQAALRLATPTPRISIFDDGIPTYAIAQHILFLVALVASIVYIRLPPSPTEPPKPATPPPGGATGQEKA